MTVQEAMQARHSVRAYQDRPLEEGTVTELQRKISELNDKGKLHIQLVLNEPVAFSGPLAKYSKFINVKNYIVIAGEKAEDLDERVGYYGEELVLFAQTLGLNSCWVGLSHSKVPGTYELAENELLKMYIAIGYGQNQGVQHKCRPINDISNVGPNTPEWFRIGVEAALLAPTAINQQRFYFEYIKDEGSGIDGVVAKPGFSLAGYTKIDLGIAKYHFELASGHRI